MKLKFFNTLGREIQEFHPIHPDEVGIYTCGPTVWNYAHIGNLRTYVFEDILRRAFEYFGYRVKHVMNITDVGHLTDDADLGEDKMIKGARESGRTVWEIAEYYTDAFFKDLKRLNIRMPTDACRATDHIEDMIKLIQRLGERGYTYSAGGNIYFDISKLPDYGKLALLNINDLKAGARIDIDENKKNPLDFALWFTRSKFEHQVMLWDSPWGRGYPGWHIECSAMSMKYLGEQFDIHCGGVDHIPVHHTNEIAQSEASTGKKWVNYWLHGEFLVLTRGKMAKSKGNFMTLSSLEDQGYDPLDYRYFCLGAHYRSQLRFSFEGLDAAARARRNISEHIFRLRLDSEDRLKALSPDDLIGGTEPQPDAVKDCLDSFFNHIAVDLNTPKGLAVFWGLLRDEDVDPASKYRALLEMDKVLGLDIGHIESQIPELDEEIEKLVKERDDARKRRDFTKADEIRDVLKGKGIILEDTPEGVRIRKK